MEPFYHNVQSNSQIELYTFQTPYIMLNAQGLILTDDDDGFYIVIEDDVDAMTMLDDRGDDVVSILEVSTASAFILIFEDRKGLRKRQKLTVYLQYVKRFRLLGIPSSDVGHKDIRIRVKKDLF